MTIWTKDNFIDILKEEIVSISFKSIKGVYTIKCTLDPDYLPPIFKVEDRYKSNQDMISVWDIDNNCIVTYNFRYIDSIEV